MFQIYSNKEWDKGKRNWKFLNGVLSPMHVMITLFVLHVQLVFKFTSHKIKFGKRFHQKFKLIVEKAKANLKHIFMHCTCSNSK